MELALQEQNGDDVENIVQSVVTDYVEKTLQRVSTGLVLAYPSD